MAKKYTEDQFKFYEYVNRRLASYVGDEITGHENEEIYIHVYEGVELTLNCESPEESSVDMSEFDDGEYAKTSLENLVMLGEASKHALDILRKFAEIAREYKTGRNIETMSDFKITADDFTRTTGQKFPVGYGTWMFKFYPRKNPKDDFGDVKAFEGSYASAKTKAAVWGKENGYNSADTLG